MARMHTRRKGRSSSKRPPVIMMPKWIKERPELREEIDQLIEKMAKGGASPSMIGLTLRDRYGVPSVRALYGKKLVKVLKEKELAPKLPEDLFNLIKKAVRIQNHLKINRKDVHNRRRLQLVEAKIHRLQSYYKRKGVLPRDWKYTRETAAIMVARA